MAKKAKTLEDKVFDCLLRLPARGTWDDLCQESLVERLAPTGNPYSYFNDSQTIAYWTGYFDALVLKLTRTDPRFDAWRESCPQ